MLTPIAIIGIGCRFPAADNPRAFWRMLSDGKDAIAPVPADRWDADAFYDADPAAAGKTNSRWGGFLQGIDRFDASFFGIGAEEARAMDPQQRLMLEVAWEALEDAGVLPQALAGGDGCVFVGISSLNYGTLAQFQPQTIGRYTNMGNGATIAANRISYFFDLRGPSFAVDAACASSLLAVHLACQSLWREEASVALAGGVNAILLPGASIGMAKSGAISPDARCRVFDAAANGCVRGEGAGVVLLKPLPRALADGDPVYAVIRASAVNQNGRSNGLGGPSRLAQEAVLREAYRRASLNHARVDYVETHSTATMIGDAMELAALGSVLKEGRPADRPCAVGSVKTNIGHLEAAAGIAGLIKVALMLKHRWLVPTLHYRRPNPHVSLQRLALRVQTESQPWPGEDGQRVASVSAAGYGGTNLHVVLAEAPVEATSESVRAGPHGLVLSAKTPDALRDLARRYVEWLGDAPAAALVDICRTANEGRVRMNHRLSVVANDLGELRHGLSDFVNGNPVPDVSDAAAGRAAEPPAGRRIHHLPTYPFQRERYWLDIEPPAAPAGATTCPAVVVAQPNTRIATLQPPSPPRDEVERRLVSVWEQTLGITPIGIRDSFFELGGTSAMALQLFAAVEREFGLALPLASLYSAPTIEAFAKLVAVPDRARWDPVVALNARGSRPPLFFVPGLGGHAFDLRALARRLGDDQPVYVLHPQGLDPNEVPLTRVEEMASAFLREIRSAQPYGPYRLGGYSFGGSVAFEMARQLETAGERVPLLALLDAYAPEAFHRRSLPRRLLTHARLFWGLDGEGRRQYLRRRVDNVWRRLRVAAMGGSQNPAAPGTSKVVDAVQRVTDANGLAWQTYRPGRYSGGVVLFRARQDDQMIQQFCSADAQNGWGHYAAGGVEVVELPCDHLQVFHEPFLKILAERLRTRLRAADAGQCVQGSAA